LYDPAGALLFGLPMLPKVSENTKFPQSIFKMARKLTNMNIMAEQFVENKKISA